MTDSGWTEGLRPPIARTLSVGSAAARPCRPPKGHWFSLLLSLGALGQAVAAESAPAVSESLALAFELPEARSTSAAVYDADERLVRTLWRGEPLAAGRHERRWDRRDDAGRPVAPGRYTLRLIHHRVKHVWEGVIGNTSARAGLQPAHRGFHVPMSLAASPGAMHYSLGYNEGQNLFHGFALAEPQRNRSPLRRADAFVAATLIASDGRRLYWVHAGGLDPGGFVAAFELPGGAPVAFSAGQAVCLNRILDGRDCYPGQFYPSVIARQSRRSSAPTGLAVQTRGPLLAMALGAEGRLRLFDKTSGAERGELALPQLAPQAHNAIAFAPDGELWVLTVHGAQRLVVTPAASGGGAAAHHRVSATVEGLTAPLAITVDPQDANGVWIAEGGDRQQLRRFDRQGRAMATIGRLGGLAGQAVLGVDRLCFETPQGEARTALAVDEAHGIWVVDSCTSQLRRFGPDGAPGEVIGYVPASYNATVDTGDPTRVFANFLEFRVDHARPLNDPQAWTLVRQWGPALRAALREARLLSGASVGPAATPDVTHGPHAGWRSVQTFTTGPAAGRTYAVLAVGPVTWVVELRLDGRVRLVRPLPANGPDATPSVLHENGDLGHAVTSATRQTVMRRALRGVDAAGDPVWAGLPTVLASAPRTPGAPAYPSGTFAGPAGPRFPLTTGGDVIFFNPAVDAASGQHLGAVKAGAREWRWQASPSGPLDGRGAFQTRRDDPGLQYGGNTVWAVDRSVVYGYHGEFYADLGTGRVGQANQAMHFRDDGLFIGQFGLASTRVDPVAADRDGPPPGLAGNAFSPTLVRASGALRWLHNDESGHGGVHRWRIDGMETLVELNAAVELGPSAAPGAAEAAGRVELR